MASSSGTDEAGTEVVRYGRTHVVLIMLSLLSVVSYLVSRLSNDWSEYAYVVDIVSGLTATCSLLAGSLIVVLCVHHKLGVYTFLLIGAGTLGVLSQIADAISKVLDHTGGSYPPYLQDIERWMVTAVFGIFLLTINLTLFEVGTHKLKLLSETRRRLGEAMRRKKLEAQLRQAQKMEAVGNLAGGIAHDFNNLLQAILGNADMAVRGLPPGDKRAAELEEITKAALKARSLTQQLVAFSRRQLLQPKNLNLNDVVTDSMKMLRRVIPASIAIEFKPDPDLGSAHADASQLNQVLMNLAINARDAMPDGGAATIETANVQIDGHYCELHPWAKPGRYVLLSVADAGCGMDDETQRQVFDPFFTTKELGQGTGLGLATVYGIVKQHDGMISLYSELGAGTVFKIYFPRVEGQAEALDNREPEPVVGGTETILLAEDDEPVRRVARQILEQGGYTVLEAEDGAEAVRLFGADTHHIDLAVLDVVMPNQGGREAYDIMKSANPNLRVLFCSGYSVNAIHTNFILGEGLHLVEKPYTRDALLRKVREVLDA